MNSESKKNKMHWCRWKKTRRCPSFSERALPAVNATGEDVLNVNQLVHQHVAVCPCPSPGYLKPLQSRLLSGVTEIPSVRPTRTSARSQCPRASLHWPRPVCHSSTRHILYKQAVCPSGVSDTLQCRDREGSARRLHPQMGLCNN